MAAFLSTPEPTCAPHCCQVNSAARHCTHSHSTRSVTLRRHSSHTTLLDLPALVFPGHPRSVRGYSSLVSGSATPSRAVSLASSFAAPAPEVTGLFLIALPQCDRHSRFSQGHRTSLFHLVDTRLGHLGTSGSARPNRSARTPDDGSAKTRWWIIFQTLRRPLWPTRSPLIGSGAELVGWLGQTFLRICRRPGSTSRVPRPELL